MNRILNDEERVSLLLQHKTQRDKKIADRIKAVLLFDGGWSYVQIAEALLIDDTTASRHLAIYVEEKRLKGDHQGSKPILDFKESEDLSDHLESKLYTKVKDINAYIKQTFNKDLSNSGVYHWLKTHNFTYKKPKIVPKDADVEMQKKFIAFYEDLMNTSAGLGDPVLFGDSVHPTQQMRLACGWIKKGKDKALETTSARKRVNIMGAINLETMQFDYADFKTINQDSTIEFFKKLEKSYEKSNKIHLILDQAGYHKAQSVKEFLKTSKITVHFLPPRSPNLNPIERLWKVMHEYVSNNKFYDGFKQFKRALFAFFDKTMISIKEILVSRLTDEFQIIIPPT